MTEEEAVKKATTGRVNKYADNVLPMVILLKMKIVNKFTVDFS